MSAIVFVKLRAVCVMIVRRFSSTLKRNKSYIFGATRGAGAKSFGALWVRCAMQRGFRNGTAPGLFYGRTPL